MFKLWDKGAAQQHPLCRACLQNCFEDNNLKVLQNPKSREAEYQFPQNDINRQKVLVPRNMHKIDYRSKGPCDVFAPWVRWERGQVGI